jgi:hypothetical protein
MNCCYFCGRLVSGDGFRMRSIVATPEARNSYRSVPNVFTEFAHRECVEAARRVIQYVYSPEAFRPWEKFQAPPSRDYDR